MLSRPEIRSKLESIVALLEMARDDSGEDDLVEDLLAEADADLRALIHRLEYD